jgi:hypothetical protein
MNFNNLSRISVATKRQWLIKKGYESAITADNDYINKLFELYVPTWILEGQKFKKQNKKNKNKHSASAKEWASWGGTNRPHHSGGRKRNTRNYI